MTASALAALTVAERWADFTKAVAIYPETNRRVETGLAAFQEALDKHGGKGAHVLIQFGEDEVEVGGERIDLDGVGNLGWLKARIDKAALAGVEFLGEIDRTTLIAFSKRLLANFTRRGRRHSADVLWPETYRGMRLVHRRFEGLFMGGDAQLGEGSGFGDDESETGGGDGAGGGARGAMTSEQALIMQLAAADGVQKRLRTVQDMLGASQTEQREEIGTDLVRRIVRLLPSDRLGETPAVLDMTEAILDTVSRHIQEGGVSLSGQADWDTEVASLLYAASLKYFGREDLPAQPEDEQPEEEPAKAEEEPKRARGHKGDDKISDDLESLRAEIEALPVALDTELTRDEVDLPAEQLEIYLYYLTHLEAPDRALGLYPVLAEFLSSPGPMELAVLRQSLETYWYRADAGQANDRKERVLAFLEEKRLTRLLRECGIFTPERIVEVFPEDFTHYLDALDFTRKQDLVELQTVCTELGEKRILASAKAWTGDEGLLEAARARRLLARPAEALLPFARIILEQGGAEFRIPVLEFLRKLKPETPAACLLWIIDDSTLLTTEYLLGVVRPSPNREQAARLDEEVTDILCRFIRSSAGSPDMQSRRVTAIYQLAQFQTPKAYALLRELVKARRYLFFPKEPRSVRAAARETLAAYAPPKKRA